MEADMEKTIPLSENIEDYLETILRLQIRNKVARSKDIAEELNIKRGSVTGMLKKLAARKLIDYEPYGYVTLTPEGENIAKKIEYRHTVLKDFLFRILEVDEARADETACRMEHAMDSQSFKKFVEFIATLDACPHRKQNLDQA